MGKVKCFYTHDIILKNMKKVKLFQFLLLVANVFQSFAEQYYNSYYSYEIDAFVECFGNPETEPYCVKISDESTNKQMYREKDFAPMKDVVKTELAKEKEKINEKNRRRLRGRRSGMLQPLFPRVSSDAPVVLQNLVLLIRFPEHKNRFLYTANDFDVLFNGESFETIVSHSDRAGYVYKTHGFDASNSIIMQNGTETHDDTRRWSLDEIRQIIPTGSVRTFYQKQLYGKFDLRSTVVGWVDINMTEAEASGGCSALCGRSRFREAIAEALDIVEQENLVDFAKFDKDNDAWVDVFTVITSSAGAESGAWDDLGVSRDGRIWSHKFALESPFVSKLSGKRVQRYSVSSAFFGSSPNRKIMCRIGVLAHEVAHFLGLEDFYDTTYRSNGLYVYDTMANSWGVRGLQLYPNNFSPRNKHKLGFLRLKRPVTGRNLIRPSNGDSDNEIYAMSGAAFGYDPAETVYIDFWKKGQYAVNHPGGILIYHADERVTTSNTQPFHPAIRTVPHNGRHYKVRLLQANGNFTLETKLWPKRYDPTMFWNQPDLELSDYGDNNIMSWIQLENPTIEQCMTTGNYLYGFNKLDEDLYEFYYEQRPTENCYKQTKPTRTY